jgi:hypothetical protein
MMILGFTAGNIAGRPVRGEAGRQVSLKPARSS